MRKALLAAALFCTVLLLPCGAIAAMTSAEAEALTGFARLPRGGPTQAGINLAARLGTEGSREALDLLISLREIHMLQAWATGYREAHKEKTSQDIEERLLRHFEDGTLAYPLANALDLYKSAALFERLLEGARVTARWRQERARKCRYVASEPAPYAGPARLAGSPVARLDCKGPPPHQPYGGPWTLLPRTSIPDIAPRLHAVFAGLAAIPPTDPAILQSPLHLEAGNLGGLAKFLEVFERERYVPATADIIEAVRQPPGQGGTLLRSMEPALRALGVMDVPDGTRAIAAWMERRSADRSPPEYLSMRELSALLARVMPEGQVDLSQVRERVLSHASNDRERAEWAEMLQKVEVSQRGLREPTVDTLILWARSNRPRHVRYILSRGIPPSPQGADGETALTATRDNFAMQRLLVESGADPNVANRSGSAPFHYALGRFDSRAKNPYEAIEYFMARGAKVDDDRPGAAPLHLAAEKADGQLVKYLLDRGAMLDHKDRGGFTPLLVAVSRGNVEAAKLLLERGADPNVEIDGGVTPLLIARDMKNMQMERLLANHGGRVNLAYVAKRNAAKAYFWIFRPLPH